MAVVPESATIINALRSGLVPAQGLSTSPPDWIRCWLP